jgi:hypothetical protein
MNTPKRRPGRPHKDSAPQQPSPVWAFTIDDSHMPGNEFGDQLVPLRAEP